MPSSGKTANLRLNQWSGADKPQRGDFNADNAQLDSQVGGHLKNSTIHVTKDDKDTWNSMYYINTYLGNDLNTRTISNLPFAPSAVLLAASDYPFVIAKDSAARCTTFAAFATTFAGSQGLSLSGSSFTVRETTAAVNGNEYISLNKSGVSYVYVLFR